MPPSAGVAGPEDLGHRDPARPGWRSSTAAAHSRATLARRAAAARTFTAFAHARGLMPSDPGPLLGMPRTPRRLPEVLRQDQVAAVLGRRPAGSRGSAAQRGRAVRARGRGAGTAGRRDRANCCYATGIRVSELCGLDLGDLDEDRRTVRVLGKGDRERTVPAGIPAVKAVGAWTGRAAPSW